MKWAGVPLPRTSAQEILDHLGVDRKRPTPAFLDELVAAYARAVPWESVSRIVRRAHKGETADCPRWPPQFWAEALEMGAGGTCFESNYAFLTLLQSLDYSAYLTINDMAHSVGCHTAIVVQVDGGRFLVDAGFPLYLPVPLQRGRVTGRQSPFHTYTIRPTGADRYEVERDRHPHPNCFTLVDRPVDEGRYRAATTADYGPDGYFLDKIIVNKVIDGAAWRYNSAKHPPHLQSFHDGKRSIHPLEGDVPAALSRHFDMDEGLLREADTLMRPSR